MNFLRLRQICLAARDLEPAVASFEALFGLRVCYRDVNVSAYGLANAIFRVGAQFIEIVAPTQPGTAVQRFIEQRAGLGGYMLIFDCDNARERMAHAAQMNVRTAHLIDRPPYLGVQLHPRDTGATMMEFNQTEGNASLLGAYHPAGPDWQDCAPSGVTRALGPVVVRSPAPQQLAARWAALMQQSVTRDASGAPAIRPDLGEIRFTRSNAEEAPLFTAFHLTVADPSLVRAAAQARGALTGEGHVRLCGVDIVLDADTTR